MLTIWARVAKEFVPLAARAMVRVSLVSRVESTKLRKVPDLKAFELFEVFDANSKTCAPVEIRET